MGWEEELGEQHLAVKTGWTTLGCYLASSFERQVYLGVSLCHRHSVMVFDVGSLRSNCVAYSGVVDWSRARFNCILG